MQYVQGKQLSFICCQCTLLQNIICFIDWIYTWYTFQALKHIPLTNHHSNVYITTRVISLLRRSFAVQKTDIFLLLAEYK